MVCGWLAGIHSTSRRYGTRHALRAPGVLSSARHAHVNCVHPALDRVVAPGQVVQLRDAALALAQGLADH
jgi:hypothetical protein